MIIANGTIEFKLKTATGMNEETGYPTEPVETWSHPIPCQYYQNRSNLQAKVGTETAHKVSYTILIEERTESERLRLTDEDGTEVGEFSMISVEPLKAVGQIRITI